MLRERSGETPAESLLFEDFIRPSGGAAKGGQKLLVRDFPTEVPRD